MALQVVFHRLAAKEARAAEGLVCQRTMRSVMVVVESLAVNHPAGLLQAQKQFSVQQLVAQRAL